MQDQQTGGCLCISCCSSSSPPPSPFPTGADTALPIAATPLDLPTILTPVSLARSLDPAEVRCASKALERSVEVLVRGMASVPRDSCAQTATGALWNINLQDVNMLLTRGVAGVRVALWPLLLAGMMISASPGEPDNVKAINIYRLSFLAKMCSIWVGCRTVCWMLLASYRKYVPMGQFVLTVLKSILSTLSMLIALHGCISGYIPRGGLIMREWQCTSLSWDVLGYTSLRPWDFLWTSPCGNLLGLR